MKERDSRLDFLRALAAIMVILQHVGTYLNSTEPLVSWASAIYEKYWYLYMLVVYAALEHDHEKSRTEQVAVGTLYSLQAL
jgi:fucose 4-O-acetylase-like acetyltransferase